IGIAGMFAYHDRAVTPRLPEERMRSRRNALLSALLLAVAGPAPAVEPLTIGTSFLKDATLRLYGFVETDFIHDTTQNFTEEQGNNLVPQRNPGGVASFAGQRGREQMSIRNSRLGLELNVPATESGLKTKA